MQIDHPIELHFTLDAKSALEGMVMAGKRVFHGRGRALMIGLMLLQSVITPLGFMALYIVLSLLTGGAIPKGGIGFVVAGITGGLIGVWINQAVYRRMAQMVCLSRFGAGGVMRLDPQGVVLSTNHSQWQTGWSDVEEILLGKRSLSFVISGIVLIAPLSAFESKDTMKDVRDRTQSWLDANRGVT